VGRPQRPPAPRRARGLGGFLLRLTGALPKRSKNRDHEVDIIATLGDRLVPFEVKYQDAVTTPGRLKGMRLFIEERGVDEGYMITQRRTISAFSRSARPGAMQAKVRRVARP